MAPRWRERAGGRTWYSLWSVFLELLHGVSEGGLAGFPVLPLLLFELLLLSFLALEQFLLQLLLLRLHLLFQPLEFAAVVDDGDDEVVK